MASGEYQQRLDMYYGYVDSARAILANPSFEAPEHPYVQTEFEAMLEYSSMGVVDRSNGLIHTGDMLFEGCVVIVPILESDVSGANGKISYSYTDTLCHEAGTSTDFTIDHLAKLGGECDFEDRYVNPIIYTSPNLAKRGEFQQGATVLHELDHAYRSLHRDEYFDTYGIHSRTGRTALEVSAYRLDRQSALACEPEAYAEQLGAVERQWGDRDFLTGKSYKSRLVDRAARSLRNTAFMNFMMDELGAEVDANPSRRTVQAFIHQKVVYDTAA